MLLCYGTHRLVLKLLINKDWASQNLLTQYWRIDKTHSNAFNAFQQIGSPSYLNPIVENKLKTKMKLKKMRPDIIQAATSVIEVKISLPANSVSLLEFTPVNEN